MKIYVALEPQDLRKSFQGLSELAEGHLKEKLRREALFVFVNKRRNRIKLLYMDGTGLWVATKRLEAGVFSWPPKSDRGQVKLKLNSEALQLLLDGVDMRGGKFKPWFERS